MTRAIPLLSLLAGCVVLPATKTNTRPAGTETSPPTIGRLKAIALQTGSSRSDIRIHAVATSECQRQVFAVTEIRKSKHAKLGVDDPRGRALGLLVAPVTIPISAIVTGFVLLNSDDSTTRKTRLLGTETYDCQQDAAGYAVALELPSGHVHRSRTDDAGVLQFAIPADEPYSGQVTVRGAHGSAVVHYEQPRPPIAEARDVLAGCTAQQQIAAVTLKLTISGAGRVVRVWLSAGDDKLNQCVATKIAGLVFPAAMHNTTVVLPAAAPAS